MIQFFNQASPPSLVPPPSFEAELPIMVQLLTSLEQTPPPLSRAELPVTTQLSSQRWPWLRVERLLGEYHIPQDSAAGRRNLEIALEEWRAGEAGADYKQLRRGWCLGGEAFRRELLGQMQERMGAEPYGAERQETMEARAEGIVAEELKRRRWGEEELGRRAKGDAGKVAMAVRLRAETAVTVKWIAERLQMGSPGYVHHLLYRRRKTEGQ